MLLKRLLIGEWNHWSDCSLHLAPAFRPEPCDCGNTKKQPFNRLRNRLHLIHWRGMYDRGET